MGRLCFSPSRGLVLATLSLTCCFTSVLSSGGTPTGQDLVAVTSADTGLTQYVPASSLTSVQGTARSQQTTAAAHPKKRYDLPPLPAGAAEGHISSEVQPVYASQAVKGQQQTPGGEVVTVVPHNTTDSAGDPRQVNNATVVPNITSGSKPAVVAVDGSATVQPNAASSTSSNGSKTGAAAAALAASSSVQPPVPLVPSAAANTAAAATTPQNKLANSTTVAAPTAAAVGAKTTATTSSMLSGNATPAATTISTPKLSPLAAAGTLSPSLPAAAAASSPRLLPAASQVDAAVTASPSLGNTTGTGTTLLNNATVAGVNATAAAPGGNFTADSSSVNNTTGADANITASAGSELSSNSTVNDSTSNAQPEDSTDEANSEDALPTVIEPVYGTNSNMTKVPIPVASPVTVPPIMPAPALNPNVTTVTNTVAGTNLNPAVQEGQVPSGQALSANATGSRSDLATTVITVRAPPRTPVTVKVQPGGPNTAVDVLVDNPKDTPQADSSVSNNGYNGAPVTVQVQPPNTASGNAGTTKSGTVAIGVPAAATSPAAGLQPVYSSSQVQSNNSNPSYPPMPAAAATTTAKSARLASTTPTGPAPWIFTQPGAKSNITIGCILPFEGPQQVVGEASMTALHMAIKDWAPKLLPSTNINLTCLNGKCQDVAAYSAMTRLAQDKVVAVVGEVCSGASVAAAGVANDKKIPMISPASTSASLSQKDYFFRTVPSDRYQGVALAKLMYQNGARAVGLVYEDSTYGYGLSFNFIAAFTNAGGTVPTIYKFAKGTPGDPQAAVQQMLAAKRNETNRINAVFVSTNNLDFVAGLLKASKAADLDLPIYGGDSEASPALFSKVQGSQSDILKLVATMPSPGTDAFVKDFAKYSNKQSYSPHAAHAYDAMVVLLRSLAAAKSRDGPSVTAEMSTQKIKGVSGPIIQFDEFGDLVAGPNAYAWIKFDPASGQPVTLGHIDARRRYQLLL